MKLHYKYSGFAVSWNRINTLDRFSDYKTSKNVPYSAFYSRYTVCTGMPTFPSGTFSSALIYIYGPNIVFLYILTTEF